MRGWIFSSVVTSVVGLGSVAAATPSAEIRDAAIRVTVIPEARGDVAAIMVKTNPRLPIWISRVGDKVLVRGNVGHQVNSCGRLLGGQPSVGVWMRGRFAYQDLPQVVIRTPLDVHVSASEAVFGGIGHAHSVDFRNRGCGDWTIGDVDGLLRVGLAGSGGLRGASAGSTDINIAGSGDVSTGPIRSGLGAAISGSGDLAAASVSGPLTLRVAGSGSVKIPAGRVTTMRVSVAGSGDVHFGGVAASLEAGIAGSGDVDVRQVTGPVVKHVAGSGEVRVGR